MASEYTDNMRYPLYTDQDKPNLRDQYNQAIREIDSDMKQAIDDSSGVAAVIGSGFDSEHTISAALAAEETARANADTALNTALATETNARENADTALNTAFNTALSTETNARENADTELSDEIQSLKRKGDVTTYGAVSGASNNDWQQIFNNCITECGAIHFPSGIWVIQSSYNIAGAREITADSPLSFTTNGSCFYIPENTSWNYRVCNIHGITFNGNAACSTAIRCATSNMLCVRDCMFKDFVGFTIESTALGLTVSDCEFHDMAHTGSNADYVMCGISCTTDNVITGCKFLHLYVAIRPVATTIISSCYFYSSGRISATKIKDAFAIRAVNGILRDVVVTGCSFDTTPKMLPSIKFGNICNNTFLWDSSAAPESYIFYNENASDQYIISCVKFDNNIIMTPMPSELGNIRLSMYGLSGNANGATLNDYQSKDNLIMVRSTSNTVTTRLFVGSLHSGLVYDAATWQHLAEAFPALHDSAYVARLSARHYTTGSIIAISAPTKYSVICGVRNTLPQIAFAFNANADMYMRGNASQNITLFNSIDYYRGPALWCEPAVVQSLPSGCTEVETTFI